MKHYVIGKNLNGKVYKIFEGDLNDIMEIQTWERDLQDRARYEDFDQVMNDNFFGDGSDGFTYEEVSKEEYDKAE